MAILSKKDVAARLGIPTNHLSVILKRARINGHVLGKIKSDKDALDDEIPENKFWMDNLIAKKAALSIDPEPIVKTHAPGKKEVAVVKATVSETKTLQALRIEAQIEESRLKSEKLRLQNNKIKGDTIPFELVKPLLLQQNQSILSESDNTVAEILRIFARKRDLSIEEMAEIRADYQHGLNESIRNATEATIKSLNNIANEYSIKRGVGDRT